LEALEDCCDVLDEAIEKNYFIGTHFIISMNRVNFIEVKRYCFNDRPAFQTRRCLLADLQTNWHLCCFIHSLYRFPL